MKRVILVVATLAVMVLPVVAHAGNVRVTTRFPVQGPFVFYWHPFFYPGPFAYGYPGGLTYAYPGPYMSSGGDAPYTYGYPGPYSYGAWGYVRPYCSAKRDGMWVCS